MSIDDFEQKINDMHNNMQNNIQNDIVDASPPFTIDTDTFYEFKEYVLNALKQLKSKMKILTIVVGN
jgi:ACT domain-containing protein